MMFMAGTLARSRRVVSMKMTFKSREAREGCLDVTPMDRNADRS